jgi:hypothetical protein
MQIYLLIILIVSLLVKNIGIFFVRTLKIVTLEFES